MHHIQEFIALNGVLKATLDVGFFGLIGSGFGLAWKVFKSVKKKDELLESVAKNQQEMKEHLIKLDDEGQKRQKANIASLHDRIYSIYEEILSRVPAQVTMKELTNLEYLWEAYSGLGGNGTGKRMYQRICELPITEEIEEKK
ncbi:hypothetical protein ACFC3Z_07835 [Enterococcus thailandicus]|uniref:hypothetical protein n=1 Tax=Enterococcus thailandicus TaxID=417368 RepID=UPI0035D6DF4E